MSSKQEQSFDVIIVGAGLAGLTAALVLHREGKSVCVFEASSSVGGRVQTKKHEGFLLDQGFQVYNTAYPEGLALLDYDGLKFNAFESGAIVSTLSGNYVMADPFRHPLLSFQSAMSPVGSLMDKWLVAQLRARVLGMSLEAICDPTAPHALQTSLMYLKEFGFSSPFIEAFFKPFFAGVFLDDELSTPATQLLFTYRMFSQGKAVLPKAGMQAIPQQLADQLPEQAICFNARVTQVSSNSVSLSHGEVYTAGHVVVATDAQTAERLTKSSLVDGVRSTTTLYYAANNPPVSRPMLVLNGTGSGRINHWCVPSKVQPDYAPPEQHLIAVSTNAELDGDDPEIRRELKTYLGESVSDWRHLDTICIKAALPVMNSISSMGESCSVQGVYLCGDYLGTPSINGAMASGRKAAEAILSFVPVV